MSRKVKNLAAIAKAASAGSDESREPLTEKRPPDGVWKMHHLGREVFSVLFATASEVRELILQANKSGVRVLCGHVMCGGKPAAVWFPAVVGGYAPLCRDHYEGVLSAKKEKA